MSLEQFSICVENYIYLWFLTGRINPSLLRTSPKLTFSDFLKNFMITKYHKTNTKMNSIIVLKFI